MAVHALALRYLEAGGEGGSARPSPRAGPGVEADSAVAKLLQALVEAAPRALRSEPKSEAKPPPASPSSGLAG